MTFICGSLTGLWLGLWFIAGTSMWMGGLLILAVQFYGWLIAGLWLPVSLNGVSRLAGIAVPAVWPAGVQKAVECVLLLPASGVFIWWGAHIAVMAIIARKNIEARRFRAPTIVGVDARSALNTFGISTLHINKP
jgi:hypothetical protein